MVGKQVPLLKSGACQPAQRGGQEACLAFVVEDFGEVGGLV